MKTVNFLEADCCSAAVIKRRTLLPGATGEPDGIFEKSLKSVSAKQRSIEFKCELAKRIINNPEKFEFDIWYVNNCSFVLDCKIIAITIKKVFISEGISSSDNVTMDEFKGN